VVATQEHTHAAIVTDALTRGKHVYCEKPLACSGSEVRAIVRVAKRMGVARWLDNQVQAPE